MRTLAEAEADYDCALAEGAAAVEIMQRKLDDCRNHLIAAAISLPHDMLIRDGALSRVNLYDVKMERDEAEAALRISVKPRA